MAYMQVFVFFIAQLLLLQACCAKGKTVLLIQSFPNENIIVFIRKMNRFS